MAWLESDCASAATFSTRKPEYLKNESKPRLTAMDAPSHQLRARGVGAAIGIGVIQAVNVVRVSALFLIGLYFKEFFHDTHVYVAQALVVKRAAVEEEVAALAAVTAATAAVTAASVMWLVCTALGVRTA